MSNLMHCGRSHCSSFSNLRQSMRCSLYYKCLQLGACLLSFALCAIPYSLHSSQCAKANMRQENVFPGLGSETFRLDRPLVAIIPSNSIDIFKAQLCGHTIGRFPNAFMNAITGTDAARVQIDGSIKGSPSNGKFLNFFTGTSVQYLITFRANSSSSAMKQIWRALAYLNAT